MLDYAKWIKQAKGFTRLLSKLDKQIGVSVSVGPPLSSKVIDKIESKMVHSIPEALRNLYTMGAGSCEIRYLWTPSGEDLIRYQAVYDGPNDSYLVGKKIYGGARFCPAKWLPQEEASLQDWAESLRRSRGVQHLLENSVPFCAIGNGDFLVLDVDNDDDNPPVHYISHGEPASIMMSADLDEFLMAWEALCYVGPESWMLTHFTDPTSGTLDPKNQKAKSLRKLFARK